MPPCRFRCGDTSRCIETSRCWAGELNSFPGIKVMAVTSLRLDRIRQAIRELQTAKFSISRKYSRDKQFIFLGDAMRNQAVRMSKGNAIVYACLGSILILALLLRLYGIDWGLPTRLDPNYSYHPDEALLLRMSKWLAHGVRFKKEF